MTVGSVAAASNVTVGAVGAVAAASLVAMGADAAIGTAGDDAAAANMAVGVDTNTSGGVATEPNGLDDFDGNVTDEIGAGMEMIEMIADDPDIMINDTVITGPIR